MCVHSYVCVCMYIIFLVFCTGIGCTHTHVSVLFLISHPGFALCTTCICFAPIATTPNTNKYTTSSLLKHERAQHTNMTRTTPPPHFFKTTTMRYTPHFIFAGTATSIFFGYDNPRLFINATYSSIGLVKRLLYFCSWPIVDLTRPL